MNTLSNLETVGATYKILDDENSAQYSEPVDQDSHTPASKAL